MDEVAQKYRITFKCHDFECGHEFVRVTTNRNLASPRCPECRKKKAQHRLHRIGDGAVSAEDLLGASDRDRSIKNLYTCQAVSCHTNFGIPAAGGFISKPFCPRCGQNDVAFVGTTAPNPISAESRVKNGAVDSTAEIIMQDYKMTDLRDDARMGETSTPKLAPKMQAAADNFFTPQKNKNIPFNTRQLKSAALRGSYRGNMADMGGIVRSDNRPNINVIHKD